MAGVWGCRANHRHDIRLDLPRDLFVKKIRKSARRHPTGRQKLKEEKQIALTHLGILAVLTLPFAIFSSMQQALNCLLGGVLIGINVVVIVWSVKRFFVKKSVAFASFVIVIKYAVFITTLAVLYARGWRADFGFVIGLTSALPTVALAAYRYLNQNEIDGSL